MIFSIGAVEQTERKFYAVIENAGEVKKREILCALKNGKNLSEDVIFAIKWLYAHSPLSDIANCDFSLFASFAQHSVFLRQNSPYALDVPEDIFLNYILHTRMGGEEICDCRRFFYDKLKARIDGLSMHDAIIEANYFNAENVVYRSTDSRTMSALATYNATFGRCGEEAVFAVNVFRAIGIPARQVYTPRWAHCDSNHAWVEVWCDGRWHFLGACEPEEVLDKGWFNNATGRAMIIQSVNFGDTTQGDEILNRVGISTVLNCLDTYAATKKITIAVKDESGNAVSDAKVVFSILNNSHLFPCTAMFTDSDGKVGLTCGLGSLNVRIIKGDVCLERMIYTPDSDTFEFVLIPEQLVYDEWEDFVFLAPGDGIAKGAKQTEAQKELNRKKAAVANAKRESRAAAMYNEQKANEIISKYGFTQRILKVLKGSYGNFDNICAFLSDERFESEAKEELLFALSEKDWCDIDISVLVEALSYSLKYDMGKEIFYPYVACPRVYLEHLSVCRGFIENYFTDIQKKEFTNSPIKIWEYVNENIKYNPSIEYGQIFTKPIGALTVGHGTPLSKKVVFVNICRTLGIPSRLNPVNLLAEYYENGHFVSVETLEKGDCTIVLQKEEGESWQYLSDYAIEILDEGIYRRLESDENWEDNRLVVSVKSGIYRIITDNRLPNGNLHASKYNFSLKPGETKTIRLHKHPADLSEMLYSYNLDDFKLKDFGGIEVRGSELTKMGAVLMWLDEGAEPTEHILNEMLDSKSEFYSLAKDIIFIVKGKESLSNYKLSEVLKTFGDIKVFFDDLSNVDTLARRLFLDPEKLPLIVITRDRLTAAYASSGYNAGSGDMIIKVSKFLNQSK